jgi:hypothetical protein
MILDGTQQHPRRRVAEAEHVIARWDLQLFDQTRGDHLSDNYVHRLGQIDCRDVTGQNCDAILKPVGDERCLQMFDIALVALNSVNATRTCLRREHGQDAGARAHVNYNVSAAHRLLDRRLESLRSFLIDEAIEDAFGGRPVVLYIHPDRYFTTIGANIVEAFQYVHPTGGLTSTILLVTFSSRKPAISSFRRCTSPNRQISSEK